MEGLRLDMRRTTAEAIGGRGLTQDLLDGLAGRLEAARTAVLRTEGAGMLGFLNLPTADAGPVLQYAADVKGRFDNVVVLGIGGSALGIIALATALLPFHHNELDTAARGGRPRLYVLDNVDPDETAALLGRLDLDRTLFNVISKSGTTGETMAGYLLAAQALEAAFGREGMAQRFVFTTDPAGGILRQIGGSLGVPMFDIPEGVGGRFSVLSPVGLAPAALTGVDVPALLLGARDMAAHLAATEGWGNPACAFAGNQYLQYTVFNRRVSVMMPYSARLRDIADWYRQLWAESLGKAVDRQGRTVNTGPLPVKSLGVTDQHSQLQLYAEGPDDKVITFLGVAEFEHVLPIPVPAEEAAALGYLGGHTVGELMHAEQNGTAWALARRGRPSLTLTLDRVDAYHVGALVYLLEMATAVSGELYDIDAFDQPGVELSKQATYALMGRPGYEKLAEEIGEI
jgi:glucose-6-phosphate isomerase